MDFTHTYKSTENCELKSPFSKRFFFNFFIFANLIRGKMQLINKKVTNIYIAGILFQTHKIREQTNEKIKTKQNIRAIMPCWWYTGIRILSISSRSIFTMNKHLHYLAHGGTCIFIFFYTL